MLEVMERREELVGQHSAEQAVIDALGADLAVVEQARDEALAEIEQTRRARSERRTQLTGEVNDDLLALYERQRTANGVGAGLLQGRRCGACRIEIDRGESSRIAAAEDDEVVRCPECGAILLRLSGSGAQ
ncbi:hypothetical protein BH11ACT7_BH11ACT7_34540 [soil metagenome]